MATARPRGFQAGKGRMLTRSGLDWTARFRPIAAALGALPVRAAYLDGGDLRPGCRWRDELRGTPGCFESAASPSA